MSPGAIRCSCAHRPPLLSRGFDRGCAASKCESNDRNIVLERLAAAKPYQAIEEAFDIRTVTGRGGAAHAIEKLLVAQHGARGPLYLESAISEQVQPAPRRYLHVFANVTGIGHAPDRQAGGSQLPHLHAAALEQESRRMTRAAVIEPSCVRAVHAIPKREEKVVEIYHLVIGVERREHALGIAKIDVAQRRGLQHMQDANRHEARADAMSADIEQVKRKVFRIDPVIAKRIAAQLRARRKAPVDGEGLG